MWVLIATILVLGITAVALISVFDAYNTSQAQMSSQNMQNALATSISAISSAFAQNKNFTGFNGTVAKTIGAVPSAWSDAGGGSYAVPGGGTATFAPANVNGGTNNGYKVTFTNLGKDFCVALGTFAVPQMVSIKVGTTTYLNPAYNPGAPAADWPPRAAAVAGNCTASGNSVEFTLF